MRSDDRKPIFSGEAEDSLASDIFGIIFYTRNYEFWEQTPGGTKVDTPNGLILPSGQQRTWLAEGIVIVRRRSYGYSRIGTRDDELRDSKEGA